MKLILQNELSLSKELADIKDLNNKCYKAYRQYTKDYAYNFPKTREDRKELMQHLQKVEVLRKSVENKKDQFEKDFKTFEATIGKVVVNLCNINSVISKHL